MDENPFRFITEDDYVCMLNEASLEKAKRELNENPKDRLDAVKFLREWVEQQPHLNYPADTLLLLFYLRTAKFSQLRAREMIEATIRITRSPPYDKWFYKVDTHEKAIQAVLDSGMLLPLPKPDREGRNVVLVRPAQLNISKPQFTVEEEIRGSIAVNNYAARNENLQVNGNVFLLDLSGMTMRHVARINSEDFRNLHKAIMGNYPGRMKGFHYYNGGTIFEALLAIFKTFMKKKYQERIVLHHTAEDMYKALGMEVLPVEYLPDDYKGPNAGTLEGIKDDLKRKVLKEDYRQYILRATGDEVIYDESKKPTDTINATFRKLNVD